MVVSMLTILLGTLYPLVMEALNMGKLSVGAPYFNAVFVPLMIPVIVLIGIGAIVRWRNDDWQRVWKQIAILLVVSTVLGITCGLLFIESHLFTSILGIVAALWIVMSSISTVYERLKNRQNKLVALANIPRAFYGMTLAHIGLAVTIVGITLTSNHSVDVHERMAPGDAVEFAGYEFRLERLQSVPGPNYRATEATVTVTDDGKPVTTLHTQKRLYTVRNMPMTEAGIDAGFTRDIYVSLGEPLDDNAWSLRLYHKPFVRWIWLGAIFMAFGGLLAASDRRYRLRSPVKATQVNEATAPVK